MRNPRQPGLGGPSTPATTTASARPSRQRAIATDIGIPTLVRRTSSGLCQYYVTQADAALARPLAEELIRIAGDDLRSAHFGHHFLADCDLMDGDSARALEAYRRSLGLAITMGDLLEIMWEVEGVGMASAGCGNSRLALRLHGAVAAQMRRLDLDPSVPFWDALIASTSSSQRSRSPGRGSDSVRSSSAHRG